MVLPTQHHNSGIHFIVRTTIMKKMVTTATRAYSNFERMMSALQSPFLLAVRLYWGWQFFQTGYGKLMHISKVVGFFTTLGIPFPAFNAYFVSSLECVGGALLFLGLGSRVIALPLTIDMLVAYIAADREALFSIFSDPGKFYASDAYTFLFASLLILIFGPGKISLDFAIGYLRKRRSPESEGLCGTSAVTAA
jgi:putative oxidoreductase